MRVFLAVFLPVFLLLLTVFTPSFAETKKEEAAPSYLEQANQKAKALLGSMAKEEVQALAHVRAAFGAVRSVEIVRTDILKAVEACTKENPFMKEDMEKPFGEWVSAVDPLLERKKKEIEAAVDSAAFKSPKDVRAYLALVDKAALDSNAKIDKWPVTEEKACRALAGSMKDSAPKLATLLEAVSAVPDPHAEEAVPALQPPGEMNR